MTEILYMTIFATPESSVVSAKPASLASLDLMRFDLAAWVKSHGWVHLEKSSKFEGYRLVSHVCIDAQAGFYYTLTTYLYPDGALSVAKNSIYEDTHPLKGERFTVSTVSKKGSKSSRVVKGKMTAEQALVHFEKNGYKRKFTFTPPDERAGNRKKRRGIFVNVIGDIFPSDERKESFTRFSARLLAANILREQGENAAAEAVWHDEP